MRSRFETERAQRATTSKERVFKPPADLLIHSFFVAPQHPIPKSNPTTQPFFHKSDIKVNDLEAPINFTALFKHISEKTHLELQMSSSTFENRDCECREPHHKCNEWPLDGVTFLG